MLKAVKHEMLHPRGENVLYIIANATAHDNYKVI